MPEGPEIRRSADALAQVLDGRKALEVHIAFARLKRYEPALAGKRIRAVQARGKAMLIHFASGLSIYSHNQLYGEWTVYPGELPETHLQVRLTLRTARGTAVLYSASEIEVLPTDELARHRYLGKLGPDVLAQGTTATSLLAHMREQRFMRRRLAALLLDQGYAAGLGNYLRSEILFACRLHPDLRPADLAPAQQRQLAAKTLMMARRAYRTAGVTNDPRLAKRLREDGASFGEYRHAVFERAGLPCYVCGTHIVRLERGRAVFICPHCQALSK